MERIKWNVCIIFQYTVPYTVYHKRWKVNIFFLNIFTLVEQEGVKMVNKKKYLNKSVIFNTFNKILNINIFQERCNEFSGCNFLDTKTQLHKIDRW